jgi:TorA maturation chaperone TorD
MNASVVSQGSILLQNWQREYVQDNSGALHAALSDDYNRLFIGPGKVLAPPWESVYKTKDRLIFQEHTLEVRKWYSRFGLESETIYREPDDHIGLELIFIAHLASLGLHATENQDNEPLKDLISAQRQFLQEHPMSWANLWCADVLEFGRTDFYRGVALLVDGVLGEIHHTFENHVGAE